MVGNFSTTTTAPPRFLKLPSAFTMSMNAALKAVRNAIDAKNFDVAADKAKAILANDADNYHAYVEHPIDNAEPAKLS